jgi:uncharacterized phage-like protein YoqJ
MSEPRVVAVTGHRPDKLGGYGSAAKIKLLSFAVDQFDRALRKGPLVVITGMALGWDQAVAQACVIHGIPFHAAIPFVGQEQMWPEESQRLYSDLLKKASKVTIVSPGRYESWKMHRRNEFMVDHCTVLVALWNGSPGGTASCVSYAERKQTKVVNLWSTWENFRDDEQSD